VKAELILYESLKTDDEVALEKRCEADSAIFQLGGCCKLMQSGNQGKLGQPVGLPLTNSYSTWYKL
jgi:hypothetical protein